MGELQRVELEQRRRSAALMDSERIGSRWRGTGINEPPGLEPVFKALADRTRRQILCLLHGRELAVNEIVQRFHLTQPSISRHLAILKSVGLVEDRRRGQRVIYHLGDSRLIESAMRFLDSVFDDLDPGAISSGRRPDG